MTNAVEKTLAHSIDWLQVTLPYDKSDNAMKIIASALPDSPIFAITGETGKNTKGYNKAIGIGVGTAFYHTEHPENKISIRWTGQDLFRTIQQGYDADRLLAHVMTLEGTLTRLDFAVDVKGYGAIQHDIFNECDSGQAQTMAQSWGAFVGRKKKDGKIYPSGTVYVGSPTSQRLLRVYDKGAERGTGEDWTRIELVSRKSLSHSLARAMVSHGVGKAGRTALRKFYTSQVEWYREAVESDTVYIAPLQQHETSRQRWLIRQVLPILERELLSELGGQETLVTQALETTLSRVNKIKARMSEFPSKPSPYHE